MTQRKKKTVIGLIHDAIERGATTVRRVQDHTIGAVYDLIRGINERVGALSSGLLAEASKRRAARSVGHGR